MEKGQTNSGSFKKGHVPWSKGKVRPEIQGKKHHNWKGGVKLKIEIEKSEVNRFWSYVKKGNKCWEWHGGINTTGRGMFWLNGKTQKAHRVSWVIRNGEIPKDKLVLHKCDNGKCVRPDHLFLGTYKDNTQDMLKKGRGNKPKGVKHWNSKLSDLDINVIRGMWLTGTQQKIIAKRFDVTQATVSEVVNFKARI